MAWWKRCGVVRWRCDVVVWCGDCEVVVTNTHTKYLLSFSVSPVVLFSLGLALHNRINRLQVGRICYHSQSGW